MLGRVHLNPAIVTVKCQKCGAEFDIDADSWNDEDTPVPAANDSTEKMCAHLLIASESCPECDNEIEISMHCLESSRDGIVEQDPEPTVNGADIVGESPEIEITNLLSPDYDYDY